jgi:hypothetical protein
MTMSSVVLVSLVSSNDGGLVLIETHAATSFMSPVVVGFSSYPLYRVWVWF